MKLAVFYKREIFSKYGTSRSKKNSRHLRHLQPAIVIAVDDFATSRKNGIYNSSISLKGNQVDNVQEYPTFLSTGIEVFLISK